MAHDGPVRDDPDHIDHSEAGEAGDSGDSGDRNDGSDYGRRFQDAEMLFHRALEVPRAERTEWLALATTDASLHALVAELLEHHDEDERLAGGIRIDTDVSRGVLRAGASVGPYKLVRELGRGGMGVVYEAERTELGKRVALKLVRDAFFSAEAAQRFELEERVLARLQHPNIAQLHDAGVTDDGTPFFAMEIVEGTTLVGHARASRLSVERRLDLFLDVCGAVQYAHGRLVVHRDIKPSNVLVTDDGQVKLLDFGVAKLIETDTDAPGLTRTEARIYTPGYAAPEQLRGEAVTTATDVYQLGALLYELLAESPAFDVSSLSPYQAEQRILGTDPPAPSTAIGAAGPDVSRPAVTRDLDSIALKALEKEPERRYASVEALAADVQRFLDGEPVRARAGGWVYRTRKFVRRNRAATTVALVVLASTGVALFQARAVAAQRDRAEREAETARQVSEFLVGLFRNASPGEGGVDAIELVDQGAERLDRELADQPEVRASFQEALGRVYNELGRYESAASLLEASLATRRELFGDDAAETASSQHFLAQLAFSEGEYTRSDSLARVALGVRERALGRASPEVMETLSDLAAVQYNTGAYDDAEALAREAADIGRSLFPDGDERTATALNTLANALWAQGRREEGQAVMREASEVHRAMYGGEHRGLAISLNNLAFMTYAAGGSVSEARASATEALDMQRRLYPDGHPDIAWTLDNLAEITLLGGDTAGVDTLLNEAMDLRLRLLEPDHPDLIQSHQQLGRLALATGQYDAAEAYYGDAMRITETAYGPDHPLVSQFTYQLAQVAFGWGKAAEARQRLDEAYRAGQASLGPEHPMVVTWGRELADALRAAGATDRALEVEAELPPDTTGVAGP